MIYSRDTIKICEKLQPTQSHSYRFLSFKVVCIALSLNEMNVFASQSKKWLRQIANACHVLITTQSARTALETPDPNYWLVFCFKL